MPKASMNKEGFSKAGKNEIRAAGEVAAVKAIAVTHAMNEVPHDHFGLGVYGSDTSHAFATFGRGEGIRHINTRF